MSFGCRLTGLSLRVRLLPCVEMLECKRQHRPPLGIGELECLMLDLAGEFMTQRVALWRREPSAIGIELGKDFPQLWPPRYAAAGNPRQTEDSTVIVPV